jgi:hypothetical protein
LKTKPTQTIEDVNLEQGIAALIVGVVDPNDEGPPGVTGK